MNIECREAVLIRAVSDMDRGSVCDQLQSTRYINTDGPVKISEDFLAKFLENLNIFQQLRFSMQVYVYDND